MKKPKLTKSTREAPHVAGCGCLFCHDERKAELKKEALGIGQNACCAPDGKRGRVCILDAGHTEDNGVHFTGARFFSSPQLPWNRPENLDDTGRRSVAQTSDGPARLRIVFAKDMVARGECGLAWDGEGAPCSKSANHPGGHKSAQATWVQDTSEQASTVRGQPCDCGGSNGHPLERHALDDAWCGVPSHEQCACNGTEYAYHLGDLPGCQNKKDRRKGKASNWKTNNDGAAESVEPRASVLASSAPETEEGADPFEDEVRSDADRELSRKMREDREAHVAAMEAEPEPIVDRDIKPASLAPEMIERTGETITCLGVVYQVHPMARIFPTPRKQYEETKASIEAHGLIHEVERLNTPDGPIIEGCTRLRICAELGITPRFKVVHVEPGKERAYVFAANLARRHLDESMRAVIAADLANWKVGENQHGGNPDSDTLSLEQAATLMNVSRTLAASASRVINKAAPEVVKAMRSGRVKVSTAEEFVKKDIPKSKQREIAEKVTKGNSEVRAGKVRSLVAQEAKRDIIHKINAGKVAPLPDGPFGVIYGDYPWFYNNSDQHEGSRGHMGYPGMKMPEILAHAREVAKRAAPSCVIAMWVTNAYIHEVGNVLEAYGATMRTMITWDKATVNDKDKAGTGSWPRGRTEHLVIASIGAPVHTLNDLTTLVRAGIREHSRKPDEFADALLKHCSGPHLELFARDPREGWITWGAEAEGAKALESSKPKRSKIFTATDDRTAAGAR